MSAPWRDRAVLASLGAALLVSIVALAWQGRRDTQETAETALRNAAMLAESRIASSLLRIDGKLQQLAAGLPPSAYAAVSPGQRARVGEILARIAPTPPVPEADSIIVIGADGRIASGSAALPGADLVGRAVVDLLNGSGNTVAIYVPEGNSGMAHDASRIVLARKVTDASGRMAGAVAAAIDVGRIQELLLSAKLPPGSWLSLRRSEDGRLVLRIPDLSGPSGEVPAQVRARIQEGHKEGFVTEAMAGVGERVFFTRVHGYPAYVTAQVPAGILAPGWGRAALLLGSAWVLAIAGAVWSQRRTRRELDLRRDSEERFHVLADLSSDWYWELDEEYRFIGLRQRRGGPEAGERERAILGKRRWEIPTLNMTERDWAPHREALERRESFRDLLLHHRWESGEDRWVSVSGAPMFDRGGGFRGYQGVTKDVTSDIRLREHLARELERAQKEKRRRAVAQATRAAESLLGIWVENVPLMVAYCDAERVLRFGNERFAAAFGREQAEIAGVPLREFVGVALASELEPCFTQSTDRTRNVECTLEGVSSSIFDADIMPHVGEDGGLLGWLIMFTDVTERRQSEARLRESEQLREAVLQGAMEAVIVVNERQEIVLFNRAAEEIFGRPAAEALGAPLSILIPERYRQGHLRMVEEFRESGSSARQMGRAARVAGLRADGAEFPADATIARLDVAGAHRLAVILRDISAQERAEQALRTLNATLEARVEARTGEVIEQARIIEQMHEAVVITDLNGKITRWTPGAQALYGYGEREVIGRNVRMLHAPDMNPALPREMRQRVLTEGRCEIEIEEIGRNGKRIDVLLSISPVRDRSAEVTGFIGLALDISARREAERRHAESEARLRTQTERLLIGQATARLVILDWDVKNDELRWSDSADWLLGPIPERGGRPPFLQMVHPDDRASFLEFRERTVSECLEGVHEYRLLRTDGETRWVVARNAVIAAEDGRAVRMLIAVHDISERKAAEAALLDAKLAAERANEAKSDFLSRMSHELRTPLHAVLGFAQLLEGEVAGTEQRESVREIQRAGAHLLEMITELLDLSRIEAGRMALNLEDVPLSAAVAEALSLVMTQVVRSGLKLDVRMDEYREISVRADPMRLRQVLLNLLTNAAKYNRPNGSIRLGCDRERDGRVRISVTDSGAGIAPEKMLRLFEPFERLGAESSAVEGTGIGLALCKRLVELMGGSIGAASAVGEGSTFWFALPLAKGTRPQVAVASRHEVEELGPLDILCVEDNPANVRLLERVFQRFPAVDLRVATSGAAGLGLARERTPDVILLDIHLPDEDGVEVLRRLRAESALSSVPVIAITAEAVTSRTSLARKSSFDAYLTKPVDIELLLATIRSLAHAKPRDGAPAPHDPSGAGSGPRTPGRP